MIYGLFLAVSLAVNINRRHKFTFYYHINTLHTYPNWIFCNITSQIKLLVY